MKNILGILSGVLLCTSISSTTITCSKLDYTFNLTTEIGEIIDTFDKREVEDYYFDNFFDTSDTIRVKINFKSAGLKDYGQKSGDCAYWLKHLVKGLRKKTAQEKYGQRLIPKWVWMNAGLWDYENDRPKVN